MKTLYLNSVLGCLLFYANSFANLGDDLKNNINTSAYVEVYYSYGFNKQESNQKPAYIYSYNRNNEANLNLGLFEITYDDGKIRSNLGFMAGTYAQSNLIGESELLRNIYEANIGVKVSNKKNIWLDAGVLNSHIGFDGAIGRKCWALTRCLSTDNTPYYETGVRLSYTSDNEQMYAAILGLNGWQNMYRINGNSSLALGTQITYKPDDKLSLNYSTFIGNTKPDSVMQPRYLNDVYLIYNFSKKVGVTLGYTNVQERSATDKKKYYMWHSPVFMFRYGLSEKASLTARAEYFSDKYNVIIPDINGHYAMIFAYSLNFDYNINDHAMWRIEGRNLQSEFDIFTKGNTYVTSEPFLTTSLAISF